MTGQLAVLLIGALAVGGLVGFVAGWQSCRHLAVVRSRPAPRMVRIPPAGS